MNSRAHSAPAPSAALGLLTIILTLLGWSSVPLFLRHFSETIDVWTSNGWRYGFSALLWAPMLIILAYRKRLPSGLWKAAFWPSVFNAVGQACFAAAFYEMAPGLVTFGLRCQLVFVAIGAWILFKVERPIIRSAGYLSGALMLAVGTSVVLLLQKQSQGQFNWRGVALAIASGLLFAAYGLSVRKCMHAINPMVAFAAICQYTGAVMVALMLIFGKDFGFDVLDMEAGQITWLLISAVIGIAIGHVFYYFSLARLGVAVTAGVLQLQPFLVAIGSFWLFEERLSAPQWLGGIAAVTGALLMLATQWLLNRRKHVPLEPVEIAEGESGS